MTVPIESVEDARRELLRLGAEAEVLEPAELRQALTGAAQSSRRFTCLLQEGSLLQAWWGHEWRGAGGASLIYGCTLKAIESTLSE